ncbi:MAG TPA: hypothetical protein VEQ60_00290 [Longimicrobium sp.]|nr:hypothetical protein [Longimicrobium sp.]
MIGREDVKALVARELEIISDPERRRALEALLTEPEPREREWSWGRPPRRVAYWRVGVSPKEDMELAFCPEGPGPEFPWCFLLTDEDDFGIDAQWNWYLEEAFVRSGLWKGPTRGMDEAYHLPPEKRFGTSTDENGPGAG